MTDRSGSGKFESPSALWQFAMETVSRLREAGRSDAAEILETATRYVTSSGWEWLGEMGVAVKRIEKGFDLPDELRSRLRQIRNAATSRHPYG